MLKKDIYFTDNNIFTDNLKYKVEAIVGISLNIEVFNTIFYLKFSNLEKTNNQSFINELNSHFKEGFINQEDYLKILNIVACELIATRLNYDLFISVYDLLYKKQAVDFRLAQLKMIVK